MDELPLVSLCLKSYNQKADFRVALEAAFAQTYGNLQIVISDDHSTDGSDEMIRQMIDSYRQSGGKHQIVYNYNSENIGFIKNAERLVGLATGELCIQADGDDVSVPNRVERIVREWQLGGCKATVIHHGYDEVDAEGNFLRTMPPRSAAFALGATIAYARRVFDVFPALGPEMRMDDQAWAKRALLLGPELRIEDSLVRYRVGSGVSTKFGNRREKLRKDADTMAQACQLVLEDMEQKQDALDAERVSHVRGMIDVLLPDALTQLDMVTARSVTKRWRAIRYRSRVGLLTRNPLKKYLHGYVYLSPEWLADAQVNLFYFLMKIFKKHIHG